MSIESSDAYFHPETDLLGMESGVDAYRARNQPRVSAPAQYWNVAHSPPTSQPSESERTYFCATYVGPPGGFAQSPDHIGATSASIPLHQPVHWDGRSTSDYHHPVPTGFPGPTRPTAQIPSLADTAVHLSAYVPHGLSTLTENNNFSRRTGATTSMRPTPQTDPTTPPIFGLTSMNPTWDGTGFISQPSPLRLYPSQLHSRMSPSTHRIQPHPVRDDTYNPEPLNSSITHNEEDFYAFLCEWTDERGNVCNMQIAGDRVSMSHHLSRHHDVIGDEKSQRPCLWRGCTETMNKGSLARHVVSRHLRAGASCGFCSKVYSRADVARRHTKKCKAANAMGGNQDDVRR